MVLITDGFVRVEHAAIDLVRRNLNQCNVFAFGIGSSVNRFLIEGLARAGAAEPFVVTQPKEAAAAASAFADYVGAPVLTDLEATFHGFDVYDVEPMSLPDLLAERPVLLFGKYRGSPGGSLVLEGSTGEGPYRTEIPVSEEAVSERHGALRYLWARHRIATLADYIGLGVTDEAVREVTSLGLTYNLLTEYTSFVAVDARVRTTGEPPIPTKQPLPLPQGVSNHAVGGKGVGVTPEPGMVSLLVVGAALLAQHLWRRRRYGKG
jgi:Ca-activated chloride channel family protein